MHYLAKKFESYFYIMCLCRNLFIFLTSQVWQEIFIAGCWNCFPALWKKKFPDTLEPRWKTLCCRTIPSIGELCLGPHRQRSSYWNVKRPLLHGRLIYKSWTQRTVFGIMCLEGQGAQLSNTLLITELRVCLSLPCLQFPILLRVLHCTCLRDLDSSV